MVGGQISSDPLFREKMFWDRKYLKISSGRAFRRPQILKKQIPKGALGMQLPTLMEELPPKICQQRDVTKQIYSTDVWDEAVLGGKNCAKWYVFPKFCGFAGSYTRATAEDRLPRDPPNLHHAVARERFGSQQR